MKNDVLAVALYACDTCSRQEAAKGSAAAVNDAWLVNYYASNALALHLRAQTTHYGFHLRQLWHGN